MTSASLPLKNHHSGSGNRDQGANASKSLNCNFMGRNRQERLTDLRLTNLSGLWGVVAVLGCLVLGLGVFRARNSGPECESLKKMCLGCGLWIVGSYLKSVLSSESFILS